MQQSGQPGTLGTGFPDRCLLELLCRLHRISDVEVVSGGDSIKSDSDADSSCGEIPISGVRLTSNLISTPSGNEP